MANMSFGVNLLPKTNNTYSLGNSDYKWNIFVNTINGAVLSNIILPTVTSTDNGKILGVSNGAWTTITAPTTDISGLAPKASPIFTGSISLGRKDNTTVGGNSYAVGTNVEASANNAHAEGNSTRAAYVDSHAEGWGSEAISQAAHAEGRQGRATAFSAHAEGCQTTASGYASHSQGMGTQAKNKSQHVAGEYNVVDPSTNAAGLRGEYAEIIGNGTDNNNRSNARVLDWNGNERLKGDLYVNCNADSTGGVKVATKEYVDNAFSSEENTIDIDKTISTPAAIQTIEDSADGLPIGMEIEIEPVQNLHGYDNPWPAGGGKNLIDYLSCIGVGARDGTESVYGDNVSVSGNVLTINQTYASNGGLLKGIKHPSLAENTSFTVSFECKCTGTQIYFGYGKYEGGGTNQGGAVIVTQNTWVTVSNTFTAQGGAIGLFIQPNFINTTLDVRNLQLELGSTATSYAPYSNICPISGWTGANVSRTGKNIASNITDKPNSGSVLYGYYGYMSGAKHGFPMVDKLFKKGTYTISMDVESSAEANRVCVWVKKSDGEIYTPSITGDFYPANDTGYRLFSVDSTGTTTKRISGELKINDDVIGIYFGYYSYNVSKQYSNLQIELGSTATAYEPYTGSTYSITFPSEAGTVYGGTLTVNQDGTGTLVVDRETKMIDENSTFVGGKVLERTKTVRAVISEFTNKKPNNSTECRIMSNIGAYNPDVIYYQDIAGASESKDAVNSNIQIAIPKILLSAYTVDGFKAWLEENPIQITYYLTTPVIYELSNLEVIETLKGTNNIWADTGDINSLTYSKQTSGLINTQDKVKINSLSPVALSGSYTDLLNKPDLSQYLTSVPTMTGATSSANGTAGLIPAPTSADAGKFFRGDGTWQDGGRPMVILSYGNSDWDDFIAAYNNNVIVYCRASSSSNPASGSQTRMAFMAYVNNATTPTEVEFQYYRSVNSHSATQMGDQVYVYKLTNKDVWSVTVREASIKEIKINTNSAGSVSWSSNIVTLNSGLPKVSASDNGKILMVVDGKWTAVTPST